MIYSINVVANVGDKYRVSIRESGEVVRGAFLKDVRRIVLQLCHATRDMPALHRQLR
jgi:hypothetical protein